MPLYPSSCSNRTLRNGIDGPTGPTGANGYTGPTGPTGEQGPPGTGGVVGSYGDFYSDISQNAVSANTEYVFTFNQTRRTNGISMGSSSDILFANAGIYTIIYEMQFHRGSGGATVENVDVWMKQNNIKIPYTNAKLTIDTTSPYDSRVLSQQVEVAGGDIISIWWSTSSTSINVETSPLSGDQPATPSVSVNISQVMYTQIGPTGFIGTTGPTGIQGPTGTGGVIGSYGDFYSDISQNAVAINTGYQLQFPTTVASNGITVDALSNIIFANSGVYTILYELQFHNGSGGGSGDQIDVWLKKGSTPTDVSYTNAKFTVSPIAYFSKLYTEQVTVNSGDQFSIWWSTSLLSVNLEALSASGVQPATPSVRVNVSQVMYTQIGPTGYTGPTGSPGVIQSIIAGNNISVSGLPNTTVALSSPLTSQLDVGNQNITSSTGAVNITPQINNGANVTTTGTGDITLSSVNNILITADNIDLSSTGRLIVPSLASGDYLDFNTGKLTIVNDSVGGTANPLLVLQNNTTTAGAVVLETYKNDTPTSTGGDTIASWSATCNATVLGVPTKTEISRINQISYGVGGNNNDGGIALACKVNSAINNFLICNGGSGTGEVQVFKPITAPTGNIELNATSSTGTGDINITAKNRATLTANASQAVVLEGNSIELNGASLISPSAGSTTGTFLQLIINGTTYYVELRSP
jgi:hypothetical protein